MSKVKKHKKDLVGKTNKFNLMHLGALVILAGYLVFSKINLAHSLLNKDIYFSFLQVYLFGVFFACLFLFIFSHEKFFPVAKEIEKEEAKKEKRYLNKYVHHGKILATILIGTFGGPVFSSLTARLLLNNTNFLKYFIVVIANIPSTVFTVGVANGFVKIFNF